MITAMRDDRATYQMARRFHCKAPLAVCHRARRPEIAVRSHREIGQSRPIARSGRYHPQCRFGGRCCLPRNPKPFACVKKRNWNSSTKNIANHERQLGGEKFLGERPRTLVEGMRQKLDDYKRQREKL